MLGRLNIDECMNLLRLAHLAADDVIVKEQIEYIYKQLERERGGERSRFNGERMARYYALRKYGIVESEAEADIDSRLYKEVIYNLNNTRYCVCFLNEEMITIIKMGVE